VETKLVEGRLQYVVKTKLVESRLQYFVIKQGLQTIYLHVLLISPEGALPNGFLVGSLIGLPPRPKPKTNEAKEIRKR